MATKLFEGKNFNILERFNNNWCYINKENFYTPYTFRLIAVGCTNTTYSAFCIDGFAQNSTRLYRLACREFERIAHALARNVDWDKYINQYIRIEHINDYYIFLQLSDDQKYISEIIGVFTLEGYITSSQHQFPRNIVTGMTVLGTTQNNCLLSFNDDTGKEIRYFNPQRNTKYISLNDFECKKLREISYKSPIETVEDCDLAAIFLRSPQEIASLREMLASRSELRAGTKDLYSYLNVKEYYRTHPDEHSIIGVITNSEHVSGQVIKVGCDFSEVINAPHSKDVFNILDEGGILPADEIQFTFSIQEGKIVDIHSDKLNEILKHNLINSGFLDDFLDSFKDRTNLICSIAFEDIFYGARRFNSYYFVISDREAAVKNAWDNMYYCIRYLLYIKSENENYFKEQKKRQAITAAIAAIMSRNMSHNLGSHFLHYTKTDLQDVKTDIDANLSGASFSFGFLQDRMNYLAAIVETDKYPSIPVNYYSSVYKGLCIDEFEFKEGCFPKNFYLLNLIRSEGYSKGETLSISHSYPKIISLKDINLSLPGGLVSVHAFYNILENFIRNSAKYQWGTEKPQNLIFTIEIRTNDEYAEITILDNKHNALVKNKDNKTLLEHMNSRLSSMRILDESGEIDRSNKGLKEMLISAFWLQVNRTDKTLGDILYEFDSSSIKEKENILYNYGFKFIALSLKDGHRKNLGVQFRIPLHHTVALYDNQKDKHGSHADILKVPSDTYDDINFARKILENTEYNISSFLPSVHESLYEGGNAPTKDYINSYYLHQVMLLNNIDSENYRMRVLPEKDSEFIEDDIIGTTLNEILFTNHLSTSAQITTKDIQTYYQEYAYADSISGKNYTKILMTQYCSSLKPNDDYIYIPNTWKDFYRKLQIKESAMTKIVIIDERLFDGVQRWLDVNNMTDSNIDRTNLELDLKNICVLNYYEDTSEMTSTIQTAYKNKILKERKRIPLYGNQFRGILGENANDSCHFLSIHLGIIEKMLTNSKILEREDLCGPKGKNPLSRERVNRLMDLLRSTFNPRYMCIHSGRGNLNKEMRDILNKYTLIPFSSLQAMFYDSKFMLCQLFYNIKY